MMKVVNRKGYRFGKLANIEYIGFGAIDERTGEFLSYDGKAPYVLQRKKIMQSVLDAGWELKRTNYTARA